MYKFSGHETFPCRYTWLPKAFLAHDTDPKAFADEPERMEKIKQKWDEDRLKARKNPEEKTLVYILGGLEDEEEEREVCLS
jgi:hypothetical protein